MTEPTDAAAEKEAAKNLAPLGEKPTNAEKVQAAQRLDGVAGETSQPVIDAAQGKTAAKTAAKKPASKAAAKPAAKRGASKTSTKSTDVDNTSTEAEIAAKEGSLRKRATRDSVEDVADGGTKATDAPVEGDEDLPEHLTVEGGTYTVEDGQTSIEEVARHLGIDWMELAEINGKRNGRLAVTAGEKIQLPKGFKKATPA